MLKRILHSHPASFRSHLVNSMTLCGHGHSLQCHSTLQWLPVNKCYRSWALENLPFHKSPSATITKSSSTRWVIQSTCPFHSIALYSVNKENSLHHKRNLSLTIKWLKHSNKNVNLSLSLIVVLIQWMKRKKTRRHRFFIRNLNTHCTHTQVDVYDSWWCVESHFALPKQHRKIKIRHILLFECAIAHIDAIRNCMISMHKREHE